MTIDDAYLAERERLANAATPGPWMPAKAYDSAAWPCILGGGWQVAECHAHLFGDEDFDNAAFIADARTAVPTLVADVRRLREENEKLRDLLAEVAGSGVELQDDRMRYLVVQIRRGLWARVAEASKP
jgi:hypothetical protein